MAEFRELDRLVNSPSITPVAEPKEVPAADDVTILDRGGPIIVQPPPGADVEPPFVFVPPEKEIITIEGGDVGIPRNGMSTQEDNLPGDLSPDQRARLSRLRLLAAAGQPLTETQIERLRRLETLAGLEPIEIDATKQAGLFGGGLMGLLIIGAVAFFILR